MQNLRQLGMRNVEPPAPNNCDPPDGRLLPRIAKRISTDHSSRADDDQSLLLLGAVMIVRFRPPIRRTAGAPRTAMRHRISQTCRGSEATRPSGAVYCLRP